MRARHERLRVALSPHDVRTRTHRPGDDAEVAPSSPHRTLACHPDASLVANRRCLRFRLLDRLTWLIRFVDAEECELDLEESGNYQFTVVCGRLTLEMLLAVREYFAPVFFGLRVLPRGLERLALEVVFKRGT